MTKKFADTDNQRKQIRVLNFSFLVFTLIITVIRVLIVRFYVDPYTNFYTGGNAFVVAFDYAATALIVCIFVLSFFFLYAKDGKDRYYLCNDHNVQGTLTLVFSSSLSGLLLLASAALMVIAVVNGEYSSAPTLVGKFSDFAKNDTFDFILIFFALLSAGYFFKLTALPPSYEKMYEKNMDDYFASDPTSVTNSEGDANPIEPPELSEPVKILSFFPILWSFINILKCFFDMSKSVNSALRNYELICFTALSLYFLAESRLFTSRRDMSKYLPMAYISGILIALSAIPSLFLSSFWILETNISPIISSVEFSFLIYIAARLHSQLKYGKLFYEKSID